MSDHLLDHVRSYLDRDPAERIAYVRAPRWIAHQVAKDAHRRLADLLSRPASLRTQGLMLVGPYANGKTMIAERFAVDDQLLTEMLKHPVLINRPLVVTPMGTRLARPSEAVLDILPADAFKSAFVKEDGEKVLDDEGRRIV
uniref:TniB family NTP-binding protein n=1 Tax=Ensifer sp. Root423 TaxID=1736534 RepID=UPI000A3E09EC|nr:TniB family NTP-binding protein [Ensifer sp. Root423]